MIDSVINDDNERFGEEERGSNAHRLAQLGAATTDKDCRLVAPFGAPKPHSPAASNAGPEEEGTLEEKREPHPSGESIAFLAAEPAAPVVPRQTSGRAQGNAPAYSHLVPEADVFPDSNPHSKSSAFNMANVLLGELAGCMFAIANCAVWSFRPAQRLCPWFEERGKLRIVLAFTIRCVCSS